jgi:hypothetical protein
VGDVRPFYANNVSAEKPEAYRELITLKLRTKISSRMSWEILFKIAAVLSILGALSTIVDKVSIISGSLKPF